MLGAVMDQNSANPHLLLTCGLYYQRVPFTRAVIDDPSGVFDYAGHGFKPPRGRTLFTGQVFVASNGSPPLPLYYGPTINCVAKIVKNATFDANGKALIYTGVQAGIAHPMTVSNGMIMQFTASDFASGSDEYWLCVCIDSNNQPNGVYMEGDPAHTFWNVFWS